MLPLQAIPGGPELLIFVFIGVFYLLTALVPLIALYLLYKIRKDTASMAESLERIAAENRP
ncbi:hypothetical protein AUR64_08790 [Haloprofundus marisrubri]|uniref:Uncharacterized protein n=1 Tax=Haloprofundus marisrubri TaxID=1514971 RepID=A0A0W1R8U3_9EURY|nr:hypothetical protein [Haloprofundus marisrubri]KTG09726.1 hypothetical protein AUR64_08790 [Haloprofundus marisrubri]